MAASEVCPAVDAISIFLEYLVDPLLDGEHFVHYDPPLSHQEQVAKQVHSVVLLYNYYFRKQHREQEFLRYWKFCKMIVNLRPMLRPYLKFTLNSDYAAELLEVEQQLSLTENEIMNSYHICTDLDASKNVSNIEGWPISKVAVLLVDNKRENCYLFFRSISITGGVWSLIEKNVDTANQIYEVANENNFQPRRRRIIKRRSNDRLSEDQLLHVGYSAVKEAVGVDTELLESYTVYSHSKERTASRFYIMKCSQPIDEGFIQVPIKDLIESVRGPLVERSSGSWKITPTVQYFHLFPYSEIISEWFSRVTEGNYGGGAPTAFKVYGRRNRNIIGNPSVQHRSNEHTRSSDGVGEGNYGPTAAGDDVSSSSQSPVGDAPTAFKVYVRRNRGV